MRMAGLILVACALSACAAVPPDSTLDAAAKTFRVAEGKGAVYVVPALSSIEVTITMDGKKVGRLAQTQFLLLEVPPGRHVLFVTPASMWEFLPRDKSDDLALDVEAGQLIFLQTVWTEENRKWSHLRVYLERMKEEDGRKAVDVRTYTPPLK